ncbi:MAG: hypothetical protein ACI9FB_003298 [Candidatus Azotimanducaceae bacterium]|jgi:hypothetical protein
MIRLFIVFFWFCYGANVFATDLSYNGAFSTLGSEVNLSLSAHFFDFDGDGDLDAVVGNRGSTNKIFFNRGNGNFSSTGQNIGSEQELTSSLSVGDVDGDGDLDILAGNDGQQNKLYLNDGTGNFSTTGLVIDSEFDFTKTVLLGDVDNDGDLDILTGNGGFVVNKLYFNQGQGNFSNPVGIDTLNDPSNLILGDVDGDGDLDLLASQSGAANRLYFNNGNGGFGPPNEIGVEIDFTNDVEFGDVDGDGDLDIVTAKSDKTNKLYFNSGNGNYGSSFPIGLDEDFTHSVLLRDIDKDGDLDFITGNSGETNKIYLNNGFGNFATFGAPIGTDESDTRSLAIGDVDGDGDLDLLAVNIGQSDKLYYHSVLHSPGDFDGDGVGDSVDPLPFDPTETSDTDFDGIGNNSDPDDDNDGILDEIDPQPSDSTNTLVEGSRLKNLATRGFVGTGDNVLIGGLVISGSVSKTILIRARGPALASAGVSGALSDPEMLLFSGATLIDQNDDWAGHPGKGLIPQNLIPSSGLESVIVKALAPGAYTVIVQGFSGAQGIGLVEVFELDEIADSRLINIATRGFVGTGDSVLIGGIVITGTGKKTIVVRAKGPSLTAQSVAGALQDPTITLLSGSTVLDSNDNWQNHVLSLQLPDNLKPANQLESAIMIDLNPGAYTVIVTGAGNKTGVGIIEVFEIE